MADKTLCEGCANRYDCSLKHNASCIVECNGYQEEQTIFETGAKRDTQQGKNRPDLIPPECLWRLARLYQHGAEHYGEHNWEKGIPDANYIASLERHILKYRLGWDDEDHLASAVFNLFGLMFNEIKRGDWKDVDNEN